MEIVIKTNNLVKQYENYKALDRVNITVNKGEIYGLVGNNGAGKTTLLRILTGQGHKTSGEFELLSEVEEKRFNKVRQRIGAIVEVPSFYPKMTLEQNLEYYRIQRGIPGKKNVSKALEEVSLYEVRKKKFCDTSLGMKQRLGIALALLGEPELLILDEPINGLDPSGIIEIRNLLLKLNKEKNITIIISSHILTELSNIATCYGILNKGKLVEELTAKKLREKCKSYLEINVAEPKKLLICLDKLGYTDYKLMPNGAVQLFDKDVISQELSEVIVSNKIGLEGLGRKSINFEDYYMSLIGGAKND
ncbi:MAG: ATP-binding cassette domain-containing protein [Sarcina sp.]